MNSEMKGLRRLLVALGGIFVVVMLIGWLTRSPEPATVRLAAFVRFDGEQFTISNAGTVAWTNGKAKINGIWNGYEYEFGTLAGNQFVTISAMDFAKGNGERFNAYQLKPQEFYIFADLPNGASGVYQGGWK